MMWNEDIDLLVVQLRYSSDCTVIDDVSKL